MQYRRQPKSLIFWEAMALKPVSILSRRNISCSR